MAFEKGCPNTWSSPFVFPQAEKEMMLVDEGSDN
jgi:hypothetical protein